jgi:uncharacterized protein YjbI with pentapeptide repeats
VARGTKRSGGDAPEPDMLGPPPLIDKPGAQATAFNSVMTTAGIAAVVFIIGIIVGFPLATFGVEFFTQNAGIVFGIFFGFFVLVLIVAGAIMIFRKTIWQSLFKRGEIEMERFARPLANVARFAAEQKVNEATDSARDLAELVLARYAWVSTRRWLMATITAFIAAIAALAGSALLFQQNQLLRTQIGLMQDQNTRIGEQNSFIRTQIELGEAQRSTSIVPELLEIGGLIGAEVQRLRAAGDMAPTIASLSSSLRSRIIAASAAARPYRYLRTPLLSLTDNQIMSSGLLRRTELPAAEVMRKQLESATGRSDYFQGEQFGEMSERQVSPERGQIIAILLNEDLRDIGTLVGADFSFAEIAMPSLSGLSFAFSMLRFSDFDLRTLIAIDFNGAYLEHARFRSSRLSHVTFNAANDPMLKMMRKTELSGTDFTRAIINDTTFTGSRGFGTNFDEAIIHKVNFASTDVAGATFRRSIFGVVDFTGAGLKSVDFDGAIVFDPTFLDIVATQAAPGTFVRERFTIEPIPAETFAAQPRWGDAWLDGLENGQAYQIKRVLEFD